MGIFHYLDNIKLYHWTTRSFSRHKATDKLLEAIVPLVDKFVEAFIGVYGRAHFTAESIPPIILKPISDAQAAACLDAFINFLRENVVPRVSNDAELTNLTDEMVNEISQCKYLFALN